MKKFFEIIIKTAQTSTSLISLITLPWLGIIAASFFYIAFTTQPEPYAGEAFALAKTQPWLLVCGIICLIYSGKRGFKKTAKNLGKHWKWFQNQF